MTASMPLHLTTLHEDEDENERQAIIDSLPYDIPTADKWDPEPRFYHPLMAGSIDGTDLQPHDRAIQRAMRATYRPNKNVKGRPECTLMIRRLNRKTTSHTVRDLLSTHGSIVNCTVVREIITGFSKGYAFVEFKHESDARKVHRMYRHQRGDQLAIDGELVVVDMEMERIVPGWIPRRLGGGIGGRKEAGQIRFGGCERPFRKPIQVASQPLTGELSTQTHNQSSASSRTHQSSVSNSSRRTRESSSESSSASLSHRRPASQQKDQQRDEQREHKRDHKRDQRNEQVKRSSDSQYRADTKKLKSSSANSKSSSRSPSRSSSKDRDSQKKKNR